MKSIFNPEAYQEVVTRLNQLQPTSPRQWGKMTPAQMLCHCKPSIEILLEKRPPVGKPNWFFKLLFKKSFYNDTPWRKNLPTAKAFVVTEEKDFETEKKELSTLIDELYSQRNRKEWPEHAMLGKFTAEQYGQSMYKHLDHHLRQFNA